MNFLNPLALIGMAAAGIPLLLHLLNLRRLKTIDFGTLRFLQELQQKQVRKLRLQQILLLIIRTLIVVCAVLALSRPTIESTLPLLGATSRSSVVILVDNSASMEAADGGGPRIDQAKKIVRQIISGLRDGDEVVVLPMTGGDPDQQIDFTRTFPAALEQLDRIALTDGTASLASSMRSISPLLEKALHAHKEVYVVSDAQQSISWRSAGDSNAVTNHDHSLFLVRVGNGQQGLEPNLSVDSLNVLTKLFQADKPIEIEALIRNGSNRDIQGALVSLAFDGRRIAQSTIDVAALSTKRVTLAASPQRTGLVSASVELESDAIDRDNTRYAGILIPTPSRVGLIGDQADVSFVRTVLSLPGTGSNAPRVTWFPTVSQASASFEQLDVIIVTGGSHTSSDASLLRQFIEAGGGAVVFAGSGVETLTSACGLQTSPMRTANPESPFAVTTIDKSHPLYSGVFVSPKDQSAAIETAKILQLQSVTGGFDIVQTTAGALVSEVAVGQGRMVYVGVSPTLESGTFPLTGLFAATTLRSTVYLVTPRDQGVQVELGQPATVPVSPRMAGRDKFIVKDVVGVDLPTAPVRLPSSTHISVPPQFQRGVVKITTSDSVAVTTVTVNGKTAESQLAFFEADTWKKSVDGIVPNMDHVVELQQQASISKAIEQARTGSELWGLFTVLALLFAAMEMMVAKFMARDRAAAETV